MSMSRKDYRQLASIIQANTDKDGLINANSLSHELADWLQADNARFDKERFIESCKYTTEVLDSCQ